MATSLTIQLLTISVLALQRQIYHNRELHLNSTSVWWNTTYDYVIVGGGTAGCVLASRLTENATISVLLIEAGGPVTVTSDIMPTTFAMDNSWPYQTVPQRYAALGFNGQRIAYARGKILGGSGSTNFAVYIRGNRRNYDEWSSEYGATGWSYADVFPYFLKSENNTDLELVSQNPAYHSTNGTIQVSTVMNPDPILVRWNEAARRMGWNSTDLNGPDQYGSVVVQTTQSASNWTRQSSYSAYIEPFIESRKNLHILVNSHVTRVLLNGTKTAEGIEFITNDNVTHRVSARKEVIVSGGSLNSPQLLMLSGIGPRSHLEQLQIPIVADLPVGEGLIDHCLVGFDFLVRNQSLIGWPNGTRQGLYAGNLYQFLANNDGPLTRQAIVEMYTATGVHGDRAWPDGITYLLINQNPYNVKETAQTFNPQLQAEWKSYLQPLDANPLHASLFVGLFRPHSRGTVRLASTNPRQFPLIDPNYLSNTQDLAALVRSMQIGLSLAESSYMQDYMTLYSTPFPGCEPCTDGRPVSSCNRYLICVARQLTQSTSHPVATCRMGNSTSPGAVVDERLRVRGFAGLRVVDASVIPVPPNANINAAVVMIAERAADLIKQDNGHL